MPQIRNTPSIVTPPPTPPGWTVTRRDFLRTSAGIIAGLGLNIPVSLPGAGIANRLEFGLVTDIHYADTETRGTRYYRESTAKLKECVSLMNRKNVDFLVELGDFKDEDRPVSAPLALAYLEAIEKEFARFRGKRFHVLGNHDMDSLSKKQFLSRVDNSGISPEASFYSFNARGIRFIVLDANFREDGIGYEKGNFHWKDTWIPGHQMSWLARELQATPGPAIVFTHQPLDGNGPHSVRNSADVRDVLEKSRKVLGVFQGHYHPGRHHRIRGIHYYTLTAMVEGKGPDNSAYAVVEIMENLDMIVTGFRRARGRQLERERGK